MKIFGLTRYSNTKSYKKTENKNKTSFRAKIPSSGYLYEKALNIHKANILKTQPANVERYFGTLGIEATFREGSEYARKFVSYCCYQASEIFRQLNHALPVKIDLMNFQKLNLNATGICNYGTLYKPKYYPIRTVLFNTFEETKPILIKDKKIPLNWENFDKIQENSYNQGFLSVRHFLSPFIHEFAHSLHYHKLFSKFGCPEQQQFYFYNPAANNIMQKLKIPMIIDGKQVNNPFVSTEVTQLLSRDISDYGATQLFESFAEAYTKDVISCMDLFNLRLTRNPFPTKNMSPEVHQVLSEIWEGLVGDGAGLI